jgi:hypothetical protein
MLPNQKKKYFSNFQKFNVVRSRHESAGRVFDVPAGRRCPATPVGRNSGRLAGRKLSTLELLKESKSNQSVFLPTR